VKFNHLVTYCVQEHSEESLYFEAFDKVLESWMKFVEYGSELPANTLLSHAVEIFSAFVHCHLAQPDGSRSVVNILVSHCQI